MLPCGRPPACWSIAPRTVHRWFPRRPRSWRSCPVPPATTGSLSARRNAPPGHPGSKPRNRSVPPTSPASKPSSSCESVRDNPGRPVPSVAPLLGFCLSGVFSFHTSDPPTRPGLEDLSIPPRPQAGKTARRIARPLGPGETAPERDCPGKTSSAASGPLRDRAAPPRGGAPAPSALGLRANPGPLTLGASKYVESGVSPRRSPPPLRFLAFSPTSWLWNRPRPGLMD